MTDSNDQEQGLGIGLNAGERHHRAYVGPPQDYDLVAAMTFNLLTSLGLRAHHRVLDIGCGSLRIGRLLIPYLNRGNYVGIEPEDWLVQHGIERETGADMVAIKSPTLLSGDSPAVLAEAERFDYAFAQSVFSHCSLATIRVWLAGVAYHLRRNGIFVATFVEGRRNYIGSDWVYPACVTYTPEKMRSLAAEVDLQFTLLDWKHPRQTWAAFAGRDYDLACIEKQGLGWNSMMKRLQEQ